jgi:hypothetical protein
MRITTILLLAAPLLSFAQTPPASPSTEVDNALRSRVTAFLQYEKEGNFRKAYDLVAEDSKDYYFSVSKQKGLPFTVDDVQYTDDFSKATVKAIVKQQMGLAGQQVQVPSVLTTRWKLEKGEWVWYHDPSKDVLLTIVGALPTGGVTAGITPPAGTSQPANSSPLPKDLSPEAAAEAAAKLAPKATIDKSAITFSLGKEATDVITFRNQNMGQVRVYVGVTGATDSVTVEPVDTLLTAKAELPVKVSYKPTADAPRQTAVEFTIEPFGSVYRVPVQFVRQDSAPQK